MTDNQFDLFILHGGMMQEGMSSDEAIAAIIAMDEPIEDVQWLVDRLRKKNERLPGNMWGPSGKPLIKTLNQRENFKVGTIWKGKRKHRFVQS